MMTLDAQVELNEIEVSQTNATLNCGEMHYIFTQRGLSKEYKDHILYCLENENEVVKTEVEFEDSLRFSKENLSKLIAPRTVPISEEIIKEYSKPREKTVRTFDRKKISILVMYAAMVLVVVIALCLTIPGTAWENDHIRVSFDTSKVQAAVNGKLTYAEETAGNIIMTEDGPVEVQLTPYEDKGTNHTNWFDKLCDWVSNIVGG